EARLRRSGWLARGRHAEHRDRYGQDSRGDLLRGRSQQGGAPRRRRLGVRRPRRSGRQHDGSLRECRTPDRLRRGRGGCDDRSRMSDALEVRIIGRARTPWRRREDAPHQPTATPEVEGVLEIDVEYRPALADLASFERIWL